uniref:Uncharacterized protein n=1 Tax=Alexandrium catenella TaxID=2925 RepID=A0A7S1M1L7_ALECA|mmetsp:Transcript_16665/g.45235  ORF Transcript_16665/g.45235 Transcript_16665/m.45235 type:complete len:204 (+) Transcript_16665:3-614(+)
MHFGAVVRTTHVTGTATDIGSTSGRAAMIVLRRGCRCSRLSPLEQAELEVDTKKLKVLLPLFLGFGTGCVLGAYLFTIMGLLALLVPASITGVSGTIYWFFRTQLKQKLKKLEGNRLQVEIQEVEEQLARAHSYLKGSDFGDNSGRHAGSNSKRDWDDVDLQIGHALEVVHDAEHTLMELATTVSAYTLESGKASHEGMKERV